MRLLYIVHQFLPNHVTGTEQYVRSLALGMRERGHDVSIFAMEPVLTYETKKDVWIEKDDEVDGIPIRRVGLHIDVQPNRPLADYANPLAVRLLRRFLDEREFDVAHVFHLRYLGIHAIDELRAVGLPIVVNLMDFWFVCPNQILLRNDGALCDGPPEGGLGCVACLDPPMGRDIAALELAGPLRVIGADAGPPPDLRKSPGRAARALVGRKERLLAELTKVDTVIAPSQFLRGVFERSGFPAKTIRHVAYGVDPRRFGGAHKTWQDRRLDQCVAIGFVGTVARHKGLHVLIAALRGIHGDHWHLHVHGNADTHPEYTAEIRDLVDNDPRITFHPAFEPEDLGTVLQGLDLLVVPSLWYENTPFTVLEAQMMRLPVLASDLGGISECIAHEANGFLFQAGSEKDLREKIREILAEPARLTELQLSRAARTLDENLDDFETLYAELG